LAVTIERFHDLPHRLAALEAAAAADPVGRRAGLRTSSAGPGGSVLQVTEALCAWDEGAVVRTVHNDAKLSNVRFGAETGRPLAWSISTPP